MDIFAMAAAPVVLSVLFRVPYVGVFLATNAITLSTFIGIWAPDVAYGYGAEAMVSDRVKETFYHEFGHAAHFNALNNNSYWTSDVVYIINNFITNNNPPYGVRGINGFERCAIIESWGAHIGPHYADRRYGLFHSRTNSIIPLDIELTRWIYPVEEFLPDFLGNPVLDSYIPEGLFRDMIDNNALNPPGIADPVFDPISGFSHADCFNAITTGDPVLLNQVEANINNALPPGVTPAMTGALFANYGY